MSTTTHVLPEKTHLTIDEQGRYLWRGTIDMRENPVLTILIAKAMGVVFGATIAIFVGIGIYCHFSATEWLDLLVIGGGVILLIAGIAVIITLLYLRSLGGTYSADYVMDETGVLFRPAPREQEIHGKVAVATSFIGALAGNPGVSIAGLAATMNDAVSVFRSVRRVKGIRRYCCIKVSSPFLYNQVFVAPEDYDFVYRFIASHCPKATCIEA